MKRMGKWKVLLTGLIVGTLALGGCSGDDGDRGPQGERGPAGPGVQTAETCTICHGQNRTADVDEHLLLGEVTTYDAEITSVDVTGATGAPTVGVTVNFTVTDPATGQGVAGLTDDFEFTIAKWIEGDARNAGYWQSYINRSRTGPTNVLRAVGERRPATDLGGGNYSYTFVTNLGTAGVGTFQYYGAANAPAGVGATAGIGDNGPLTSAAAQAVLDALDLAWDGAAVTRIAIASLSNPAGPEGYRFNAVADFIPNTGAIQNEFENWAATTESCNACHATTTPGAQMSLPNVHGDRRYEVALCVTCHNRNTFDRQASTDDAWVAIDMATMIHNIHRGAEGYLVDGRDYSGLPYPQCCVGGSHLKNKLTASPEPPIVPLSSGGDLWRDPFESSIPASFTT